MEFERKAALVTGATGFVGRRLCQLLQSDGWKVTGLSRRYQKGPWHSFIEADLSTTDGGLEFDATHIFHLAGKAHALSEIAERDNDYQRINVEGTKQILRFAGSNKVQRFVFFSSVKAMGEGNRDYGGRGPIDESFPSAVTEPYGLSKLEAEQLVLGAEGIGATVLRPTLVYGPHSKGNLTRMAAAIRAHKFPPIPDYDNQRSVVHVDDLCRLAASVALDYRAIGQTFIAAEPKSYSTREIYASILNGLGRDVPTWRLSHPVLRTLGLIGDVIGRVRHRRFMFDSKALEKLSESAWYDGSKTTMILGFQYQRNLAGSMDDLLHR